MQSVVDTALLTSTIGIFLCDEVTEVSVYEINFHIVQCIHCYRYRTSLRSHILFSVYEKRKEKFEIFGRLIVYAICEA